MRKVSFILKHDVQDGQEPIIHIANIQKTRCGKVLKNHNYSILDNNIAETCFRCIQLASGYASARMSMIFTKYE